MKNLAIYTRSGEIKNMILVPEELADRQSKLLSEHEKITPVGPDVDATNWYIEAGKATKKRTNEAVVSNQTIIANGTDEVVITNIPAGTTVTWPDGQADEVTDGEVRFSVDLTGTYTLVFEAVEYLQKEVTIEALAPTKS